MLFMEGDEYMINEIGIFNQLDEDLEEYEQELKTLLNFVLEKEKLENVEFNVILVDNETIHEINKTYRGIDRPTDVISFALEDTKTITLPVRLLGDIYISIPKAREQSEDYGHSFKREISFLAVHGLLHLLGYDHMEEKDEQVMFKKQEDILTEYGLVRGK